MTGNETYPINRATHANRSAAMSDLMTTRWFVIMSTEIQRVEMTSNDYATSTNLYQNGPEAPQQAEIRG
jgi:hypothetical protein